MDPFAKVYFGDRRNLVPAKVDTNKVHDAEVVHLYFFNLKCYFDTLYKVIQKVTTLVLQNKICLAFQA